MKIAIVGAGAMGSLYGAKLSQLPENQVFLLDVWKEHVDAITANGLVMEEDGSTIIFDRVKASGDPSSVGPCDLVILFVKSTLTKKAVSSNRQVFGPDTVVMTLQNGLGNVDAIAETICKEQIIAGTTAHGATMLSPGCIRHAGKGLTILGELTGEKTERLQIHAELFNRAGLETVVSDNVMGLIWDKLLVNVGINPLTGLTGLPNGQLPEHPELLSILKAAVSEAAAVASAKGIRLSYEDPVAHTVDVCKATAANRSSMLQDISSGRETEITMINGAIVREAQTAGIPTPVNEILTNLILFKQKND